MFFLCFSSDCTEDHPREHLGYDFSGFFVIFQDLRVPLGIPLGAIFDMFFVFLFRSKIITFATLLEGAGGRGGACLNLKSLKTLTLTTQHALLP